MSCEAPEVERVTERTRTVSTSLRTLASRPIALAVGLGTESALRADLAAHPGFDLIELSSEDDLLRTVVEGGVTAVVLGPALAPQRSAALLRALPAAATANVVLASGKEKSFFQDLVDEDRIFFLSEAPGRAADVAHVVASAVRHRATKREAARLPGPRNLRVLALARRLSSARDVDGVVAQLLRWTTTTLPAARAHLLLYDPKTETLIAPSYDDVPERRESAAAGLAAFVARTATAVRVSRADEDPRYDREADDPEGRGNERWAAVPVGRARGFSAADTIAVLVVVRAAAMPPFSDDEMSLLREVADEIASPLDRVVTETKLLTGGSDQPFRSQALAAQFGPDERAGDVLRLSPAWTSLAYVLVLTAIVAAIAGALAFDVHDYASGQAVVRFEDKGDLTTAHEGIVASLGCRPGDVVVKGQSLVRLVDAAETAEAERLAREFELQLVAVLRDPVNQSARTQLSITRAQRDAAEARLAERTLTAPRDGIVSGVRVRPGQKISAGDVVLSLVGDRDIRVVGLLPARYRAELKPGATLRFQLAGYEHVYQSNPVESVGEVVSEKEAARYLGIDALVEGTGSVVLVTARLDRATYEAGGRRYRYHDGMPGTAEVRVRSEPVLLALVPALRSLVSPNPGASP